MAEHLASIFGTEKDRVNCPFYFKIGACRHGDRCSRLHTKPSISPTLLLSNMYQRPDMITPGVDPQGQPLDPKKIQSHFEDFYEDLFQELSKYGDIQSLNICDNLADHMVGNVYVQFREEDQAQNALQNLMGRSYEGRPIIADFSPVTDFREATCRQYEENVCNRGGYCNFMHLKKISSNCFGEVDGGMIAVEAEAIVLVITTMRSVMVQGEGVITATMTEAEGLEAEVLVVGGDEAEVLGVGEIGVQSGKAAPREGQKLSNGIRKEKRQDLLEIIAAKVMIIAMVSNIMVANPVTIICIRLIKEMEAMTSKAHVVLMVGGEDSPLSPFHPSKK
ncbi:Splicing factor U2af small subunit B [Sesamum angolense]|uniref:Splicing factor U2af small subunit B n=1 Tax=Sesamum angolense TaxID=2727404 RepID=A0AAE2BSZ5_9LAMI|nr:Splicing factor U2af small subunit B [Sesamum angolense]